jgi:type IV pilus assembly protein PilE
MGRKGVTVLELLMVVVIIGILGAVAIPQYVRVAERSRQVEARDFLTAIRSAEARYFSQRNTYVALDQLDFDPTNTAAIMGALRYFGVPTITCSAGALGTDCTAFTLSMLRNGTEFSTMSGCTIGYAVTLTSAGAWTGCGPAGP